MSAHALFSGSGPGAQTRDGCSVALYEQLPYLDELEDAELVMRPGASLLELCCGTGRLTRRLLASGAVVTAVDNSHEMLRSVPDATTKVQADIEALDLGRTFDTVLLASGLINHPDADARAAFAGCARRHLAVGGRFVLQRQDADWLADAEVGHAATTGAVAIFVEAIARETPRITMTVRYERDGAVWRHSFTIVSLGEPEIETLLSAAGFDDFAWLGRNRRWLHACAAPLAGPSR